MKGILLQELERGANGTGPSTAASPASSAVASKPEMPPAPGTSSKFQEMFARAKAEEAANNRIGLD